MPDSGEIRASKAFRAKTAKEALARISRELGPEAVILAHRRIRDADGAVGVEATATSDRLGPGPSPAAFPSPGEAPARRVVRTVLLKGRR